MEIKWKGGKRMKKQFVAVLGLFLLLLMPQIVSAQIDFNQGISAQDQATFDQILEPVLKIYNLVKYLATAIAALVMLFAGVNYTMSGSDPKRRENAKSMIMYVVIGLVIVWAAPLVVQFIVG